MNRVKDYKKGYCIVALRHWQQYGKNAFVEWFTKDEDEAMRVRSSYERSDNMCFIIVEV